LILLCGADAQTESKLRKIEPKIVFQQYPPQGDIHLSIFLTSIDGEVAGQIISQVTVQLVPVVPVVAAGQVQSRKAAVS